MARDLHERNIDGVVTEALRRARLDLSDLDAIAVTVKPGLALSLLVGVNHAKELCRKSAKPLIPIHHMEAHALTARLVNEVGPSATSTPCVRNRFNVLLRYLEFTVTVYDATRVRRTLLVGRCQKNQ